MLRKVTWCPPQLRRKQPLDVLRSTSPIPDRTFPPPRGRPTSTSGAGRERSTTPTRNQKNSSRNLLRCSNTREVTACRSIRSRRSSHLPPRTDPSTCSRGKNIHIGQHATPAYAYDALIDTERYSTYAPYGYPGILDYSGYGYGYPQVPAPNGMCTMGSYKHMMLLTIGYNLHRLPVA